MRILCFAQSFLPVVGGAERFLDGLARRMAERGHEVTVLAARIRPRGPRSAAWTEPAADAPYRLVRYPKPFSKRLFARHTALWLAREHARARPDVLHAHGGYPQGYAAALYARLARVPWCVRPIGVDILPGEGIRRRPVLERRLARSLAAADRVVAQSLELERLVRELGVPAERIVRIPNAAELAPDESAGMPPAPRSDAPLVAALGVFFRKKGFDVLIEALRVLQRRMPAVRLALAGDGEERAALERAAAGLPVEFAGIVEGSLKRAFLERAWVFASPARREPFSNANLEALAAGLPIVASAVGGNREIVADGVNGFLVPSEDPAALAAALERVLGDPELAARMRAAALERARAYAWPEIAARYERLYAELAALRGAGAR